MPTRAIRPATTDVGDPIRRKHTPEPLTAATVGTDHRGWCNLDRSVDRSVPSPGPAQRRRRLQHQGRSPRRRRSPGPRSPARLDAEIRAGARGPKSAGGPRGAAGDAVGCRRTRDRLPGAPARDRGRQPGDRQDPPDQRADRRSWRNRDPPCRGVSRRGRARRRGQAGPPRGAGLAAARSVRAHAGARRDVAAAVRARGPDRDGLGSGRRDAALRRRLRRASSLPADAVPPRGDREPQAARRDRADRAAPVHRARRRAVAAGARARRHAVGRRRDARRWSARSSPGWAARRSCCSPRRAPTCWSTPRAGARARSITSASTCATSSPTTPSRCSATCSRACRTSPTTPPRPRSR